MYRYTIVIQLSGTYYKSYAPIYSLLCNNNYIYIYIVDTEILNVINITKTLLILM